MGKRHYWISHYQRNQETIEITIRGPDESIIESFRVAIRDKKSSAKVMRILKEKYNFSPEISHPKSINSKNEDEDLNWLRKSSGSF